MKHINKYIVILDTNIINPNGSFTSFFGGQGIIRKLLENKDGIGICKVVIPLMVMEELTKHKREKLTERIKKIPQYIEYLQNSNIYSNIHFSDLYKVLEQYNEKDKRNTLIEHLKSEESKDIEILDFPQGIDFKQTLNNITQCILNEKAPYTNKKKKGEPFKDVVIYYTILAQAYSKADNVYFMTADPDFTDAFSPNDNVTRVWDYDDFRDAAIQNNLEDKGLLTNDK